MNFLIILEILNLIIYLWTFCNWMAISIIMQITDTLSIWTSFTIHIKNNMNWVMRLFSLIFFRRSQTIWQSKERHIKKNMKIFLKFQRIFRFCSLKIFIFSSITTHKKNNPFLLSNIYILFFPHFHQNARKHFHPYFPPTVCAFFVPFFVHRVFQRKKIHRKILW